MLETEAYLTVLDAIVANDLVHAYHGRSAGQDTRWEQHWATQHLGFTSGICLADPAHRRGRRVSSMARKAQLSLGAEWQGRSFHANVGISECSQFLAGACGHLNLLSLFGTLLRILPANVAKRLDHMKIFGARQMARAQCMTRRLDFGSWNLVGNVFSWPAACFTISHIKARRRSSVQHRTQLSLWRSPMCRPFQRLNKATNKSHHGPQNGQHPAVWHRNHCLSNMCS